MPSKRSRARPGSTAIAAVVGAALALAAACVAPTTPPPATTTTTSSAQHVPNFRHVFFLLLENESFDAAFGPTGAQNAPYLNSLATHWGFAPNTYGEAHLSLPNYLSLTSGQRPNYNTELDCPKYDCVYADTVPSIADQVEASGRTWKLYADGMATPCLHGPEGQPDTYQRVVSPAGVYSDLLNPFVYYGAVTHDQARCDAHDVPYPVLHDDLAANHLPDYGYIAPDLCHSGHDASCGLAAADAWLSQEVPAIITNSDFADGGVLVITFDEADTSDTSGCCGDSQGGHIGAIVIAPSWGQPAGFQDLTPYNHYSMLRTVEDAWGFPHLGGAADAGVTNMAPFFTSVEHAPTT